jgi:four helix bundle protein
MKGTGLGVKSYRELTVWQWAMDLAEMCYLATKSFPDSEKFGLISQICRSAASVPANIAEGHGREHTKEYLHHLSIAAGSVAELETHLMLSQRIGFLSEGELARLLDPTEEVGKMLTGLRQSLKAKMRDRG